jgi:hypothetical protein
LILERGDMWSVFDTTDIFMITTNPVRRKDGAVVMGRGIALEAKERFPRLPFAFGEVLDGPAVDEAHFSVGFIDHFGEQGTPVWYFMVKNHWRNPASLSIIEDSVDAIRYIYHNFEGRRVDLNFPGIGNGHLDRESVLRIIQQLPDNFYIWEKE